MAEGDREATTDAAAVAVVETKDPKKIRNHKMGEEVLRYPVARLPLILPYFVWHF